MRYGPLFSIGLNEMRAVVAHKSKKVVKKLHKYKDYQNLRFCAQYVKYCAYKFIIVSFDNFAINLRA